MAGFGKRSLDNLRNVHPHLVHVLCEAVRTAPVDFTITDGVRTLAQQQALYAKGRTTAGPKVTNADGVRSVSNHQAKADGYGYAVDLYPYVGGAVDVNDRGGNLPRIAAHIKSVAAQLGYRVEWGGDWKTFKDMPHFELK